MSLNEQLSSLSESDIETLDQTLSDISQTLTLTMLSDLHLPTSFESLSNLQSIFSDHPHKGFLTLWVFFELKRLESDLVQNIATLHVDSLDFVFVPTQCAVFLSQIIFDKKDKLVYPVEMRSDGANVNKILDIEIKALDQAILRDSTLKEKTTTLFRKEEKIREIPKSILTLTHLTELLFPKNEVREPVLPAWVALVRDKLPPDALAKYMPYPAGMNTLSNLVKIDLSENGIANFPAWIHQLPNLKELHLAKNKLDVIPENIGKISNLETLNLHKNPFSTLPPTIGQLQNLKQLCVSHSSRYEYDVKEFLWPDEMSTLFERFTIEDGAPVFELTVKEWILHGWISKNFRLLELQIEGILQRVKREPDILQQITRLDISKHDLSALPGNIVELKHLTTLSADDNKFEVFPVQLLQLSNLETLDLYLNQLSSLPDSISELSNLRQLNLKANRFIDAPTVLNNLPKLTVNLQANRELKTLHIDVRGIKLDRIQWYRLHPTLASKIHLRHFELDNTDDPVWSKERLEDLQAQYVRRQDFQDDYNGEGELWSSKQGNSNFSTYYHPSLMMTTMRRKLKDFWRQHADRRFFNEDILVVHWIGWLPRQSFSQSEFEKYVELNPIHEISDDELSAHGYTKAEALLQHQYNGVGIILRKKQVTYASKIDAWSEELSKSKQSKAIVNKDGSTWRPDGHDYDGAKEDEAKRKGQKSPHGYGSWRDGYDKHRKMLQQIAQGENTDGKRVVSIEEFHTQSGLPKRPELLYSSDSVLLSEVDIDESGLVYELFVDNWSWDGIIVTGWHSVRREMIERLAPGVQLFTMDEAIAEFFPNESP